MRDSAITMSIIETLQCIAFRRNLTKSAVLYCKIIAFYYLAVNQCELSHLRGSYHFVYINKYISYNILNVNGTGIVSFTVLMMSLVTLSLVTFVMLGLFLTKYQSQ